MELVGSESASSATEASYAPLVEREASRSDSETSMDFPLAVAQTVPRIMWKDICSPLDPGAVQHIRSRIGAL